MSQQTIKSLHYRLNIGINAALKLEKLYDDTPEKYDKVLISRQDLKEIISDLFLSFEHGLATIEDLDGQRRNYRLLYEAYKMSTLNEVYLLKNLGKGANNAA